MTAAILSYVASTHRPIPAPAGTSTHESVTRRERRDAALPGDVERSTGDHRSCGYLSTNVRDVSCRSPSSARRKSGSRIGDDSADSRASRNVADVGTRLDERLR